MNKLWCFGDSFTYGVGVYWTYKPLKNSMHFYLTDWRNSITSKGNDYYDMWERYNGNNDKRWSSLLANKLNLEEINLSKPGISNDMIFDHIIYNFDNIKKDDVVMIGSTDPRRVGVVCEDKINMSKFSSENRWDSDFSEYYNKTAARFNNAVGKNTKFWKVGFGAKGMVEMLEYRMLNSEILLKEANINFQFIVDRFMEKDIKCILWGKDKWTEYETIGEDTDGIINDWHWSLNGNREMYEWSLKKLYSMDNKDENKIKNNRD